MSKKEYLKIESQDASSIIDELDRDQRCTIGRAKDNQMKWVSVKDKLPLLGQIVLIYHKEKKEVYVDEWCEHVESPVSFSSQTIVTGVGWATAEYQDVSHWMPLPNPPANPKDHKPTE